MPALRSRILSEGFILSAGSETCSGVGSTLDQRTPVWLSQLGRQPQALENGDGDHKGLTGTYAINFHRAVISVSQSAGEGDVLFVDVFMSTGVGR
jgi:hypothetical protein